MFKTLLAFIALIAGVSSMPNVQDKDGNVIVCNLLPLVEGLLESSLMSQLVPQCAPVVKSLLSQCSTIDTSVASEVLQLCTSAEDALLNTINDNAFLGWAKPYLVPFLTTKFTPLCKSTLTNALTPQIHQLCNNLSSETPEEVCRDDLDKLYKQLQQAVNQQLGC